MKLAGRGAEEDESSGDKTSGKAKSRTTKMIVKNVPFEATKKDIRELFGYVPFLLTSLGDALKGLRPSVLTVNSSPFEYPRSSIIILAGLHSSNSSLDMKPRAHMPHSNTPIYWVDTSFLNGPKKRRPTSRSCERRLELGSVTVRIFRVRNGSWLWGTRKTEGTRVWYNDREVPLSHDLFAFSISDRAEQYHTRSGYLGYPSIARRWL